MKPFVFLLVLIGLLGCARKHPTASDADAGLALYRAFVAQSSVIYNKSSTSLLPNATWTESRGNGMTTIIIRDSAFDEGKKSSATEALKKAMRLTNTQKATLIFTIVPIDDAEGAGSASDEHVIKL